MNLPSPPPWITLRHGAVRRNGETLIHDIDLEVHPREIVTVIGPNGAGKSTLLHALLGLIPLSAGTITRHPQAVIGFVPQRVQTDSVLPLPVRDFILLSCPPREQEAPQAILAKLGSLHLISRQLHTLSGGEMQRVLLARALARRPNLLVLDEPTQGVDVSGEQEVYAFLDSLRRTEGVGVLMVSHDLHMVMAGTDRVICLNRHMCCSGTPTMVKNDPGFLTLFGPQAEGMGLYQHHHNHRHPWQGREVDVDG